ncbi:hypothetical protein ACQ7B2_10875, partial [Escherichia coli]
IAHVSRVAVSVQKGANKILVIVALIALILGGATAASVYWLREGAYQREQRAAELTGGDPGRGPEILRRYGCVACHTVRGVAAPGGLLGPN